MIFQPIENGILLIDKPVNITSFGVVARVRHRLTDFFGHKIKVGHTGTLDPFASGLMILVVGSECKNASKYSKLDKTYLAEIILGRSSTTDDPEGDISEISDKKPNLDEIEQVLSHFTGEITQKPPIYSAIKIGGERAYKLARKGRAIEMPERKVTVYSIAIVSYDYPILKLRVRVSSGTYIRSLAKDIGTALQTGAYCLNLRRESIGDWSLDDAVSLSIEDI